MLKTKNKKKSKILTAISKEAKASPNDSEDWRGHRVSSK